MTPARDTQLASLKWELKQSRDEIHKIEDTHEFEYLSCEFSFSKPASSLLAPSLVDVEPIS